MAVLSKKVDAESISVAPPLLMRIAPPVSCRARHIGRGGPNLCAHVRGVAGTRTAWLLEKTQLWMAACPPLSMQIAPPQPSYRAR
jgi:hypothetical protein